jgi:hypothetical protein
MAFLTKAANRGSIATGYEIENSLKLEDDNSEGLTKNYSGDGDRRTWTYSTWIKRTELSQDYYCLFFAGYTGIQLMSENYLRVELYDGTTTRYADTNQLFRDTSAWYHIVVTLDSTDSTASDRVKIWINGSRVTDFGTSTYASMSQNDQFGIGQASSNYQFGHWFAGGANDRRFCGYVAETHYVNGTALEASDFGEYDDNNIWIPKEYTGSHGSKGFYLKFDDSSNLGKDSSSGGIGDFTESNITSADQATDSPTNNFCTWNVNNRTNGNIKNQEGGTKVTTDGGSGWCSMVATMGVTKGKWYWEAQRMSSGTPNDVITGIVGSEDDYVPYSSAANYYIGNVATSSSIGYYQKNYPSQEGSVVNGVSLNFYSQGGDTIMFGLDMDNEKMYFGLNGTWKGTGDSIGGNTAGASTLHSDFDGEFVLPAVSVFQGNNMTINFGGYAAYTISSAASDANGYGTFEYAPPSGFYALCTKNLAEYG